MQHSVVLCMYVHAVPFGQPVHLMFLLALQEAEEGQGTNCGILRVLW